MSKIYDILVDLFNKSDYESLVLLAMIIFFVLLFKEFRKSKLKLDDLDSQRINNALEKYNVALASLKKLENKTLEIDLAIDNLYALYPYATKEIMQLINEFNKDSDLTELRKVLEKEAIRIKNLQHDSVSFKYSNKALDVFSYTFKKYKISSLVAPIGLATITMFFILATIGLLGYLAKPVSITDKIIAAALVISSFINLLMLLATIDLLDNPKFKKNIFNYVVVTIFYINTFVLCLATNLTVQLYYIIATILCSVFVFISNSRVK